MPIQLQENIATGSPDRVRDRVRLSLQRIRLAFDQAYDPDPVFVLGTGRSGTHWVAEILEHHPEIHALIEKPPIFHWVTEMAIDPLAEKQLFEPLVRRYRLEAASRRRRRLLDKSHPNIWLAEALAETFPKAQFIGVLRDVFGTVASSLRHKGVRYWAEHWNQYPVPNRFLGITMENLDAYAEMSLAARCAVRWRAHLHRLDELESRLGERMIRLRYHELQTNTHAELDRLQGFLGLKKQIPFPDIKTDSLDRWKQELSQEQVADIRDVVGDEAERS
jgi:hypothetical protein